MLSAISLSELWGCYAFQLVRYREKLSLLLENHVASAIFNCWKGMVLKNAQIGCGQVLGPVYTGTVPCGTVPEPYG